MYRWLHILIEVILHIWFIIPLWDPYFFQLRWQESNGWGKTALQSRGSRALWYNIQHQSKGKERLEDIAPIQRTRQLWSDLPASSCMYPLLSTPVLKPSITPSSLSAYSLFSCQWELSNQLLWLWLLAAWTIRLGLNKAHGDLAMTCLFTFPTTMVQPY